MVKRIRKSKKKAGFRAQFKKAWEYLEESQNYFYFVLAVFAAAGVVGFFNANELRFIDELLEKIIIRSEGLNTAELIFFILQNNLQSALLGLFSGVFFGVFSFLVALTNGVILGYVFERVAGEVGFFQLWRILPHGIFELPAIFIALGLGVKLGTAIFAKNIRVEFKRRFFESVNAFLMIVVPLLVVAAVIEGILISLSS